MRLSDPSKSICVEVFHDHREFDTFIMLHEGNGSRTTVKIDRTYSIPYRDFKHLPAVWKAVEADWNMLFRFIRQPGREVVISFDIAQQTIQYLKEAN